MKKKFILAIFFILFFLIISYFFLFHLKYSDVFKLFFSQPKELSISEKKEVYEWMRENVIYLETKNLTSFKKMIGSAFIVALGEPDASTIFSVSGHVPWLCNCSYA